MASNRKLTALIKGRAIAGTANADDVLTVTFDDGSKMTVQTAAAPSGSTASSSAATGGTIKAVRQAGTKFSLDFESGSVWEIQTAEETSSVLMRDKNGVMEYAD